MTVLIAKQNSNIILNILPKVKIKDATKNTQEFTITQKTFDRLYNEVKLLGYNPYSLMTWY